MVAARSGPGLWVTAAGSALAFATMFLPASGPADPGRPGRPSAACGPGPPTSGSTGLRRGLQIALGVLWLADGALQLQPFMFGRGFVNQILMPAYMGSPAGVTGPAMAFTRLVLHAPAAWNAAFAVTQLLLGAGLLWRPRCGRRWPPASSGRWACGGSAKGWAACSAARPARSPARPGRSSCTRCWPCWPGPLARARLTGGTAGPVAAGSPLGLAGARVAWLVLWGSFAYFILQSAEPGAARAARHDHRPGGRGTGVGRRHGPGRWPAPPGITAS